MSAVLDGFEQLLNAQEEAFGTRLTATVGAVANKDAIVEEITYDEIIAAGGVGESGGFRIQMRVSDFATKPAQLADATTKGITLSVLTVEEIGGIYRLTIGDAAIE